MADEPVSRSVTSQRLRLHLADWGNEAAPPLILVHGGRDHCRSWDWVARRLRRDWHVMAPDLRGHGDSDWTDAAGYTMAGFIRDLARLVAWIGPGPVTLLGHSLGGAIASRYAGIFPNRVARLIAIEGLGPSPQMERELAQKPVDRRIRDWIDADRALEARPERRYASVDDAASRMRAANSNLSEDQVRHLTRHGVRRHDDGTYGWKFDPHIRAQPPYDMTGDDIRLVWSRIACPALLVYGAESWASNPALDGRAAHFQDARVAVIEGAGHWVHHDRLEEFMALARRFLAGA